MKKFEEIKFNIGELKGISAKNIEEHLKLYAGYVKNANLILEKLPEYDRIFTRFVAAHATPDTFLVNHSTLGEVYYNTANTANTLALAGSRAK